MPHGCPAITADIADVFFNDPCGLGGKALAFPESKGTIGERDRRTTK
jgi:hypothetical protein